MFHSNRFTKNHIKHINRCAIGSYGTSATAGQFQVMPDGYVPTDTPTTHEDDVKSDNAASCRNCANYGTKCPPEAVWFGLRPSYEPKKQ